jgi:hypothetical protein
MKRAALVCLAIVAGLSALGAATTTPGPSDATISNMTLYVNHTTGLDSQPCTLLNPCKTFAAADKLVPYRVRHTIAFVFTGGTYAEKFSVNHVIEGSGGMTINGTTMSLSAVTGSAVTFATGGADAGTNNLISFSTGGTGETFSTPIIAPAVVTPSATVTSSSVTAGQQVAGGQGVTGGQTVSGGQNVSGGQVVSGGAAFYGPTTFVDGGVTAQSYATATGGAGATGSHSVPIYPYVDAGTGNGATCLICTSGGLTVACPDAGTGNTMASCF